MARAANFLLLAVALSFFVLSVSGHSNYTDDSSSVSQEDDSDQVSDGEAVGTGQNGGGEEGDDDDESSDDDDDDDDADDDESDDEDEDGEDKDYVNDGVFHDYLSDDGDPTGEKDIEEEVIEPGKEDVPKGENLPPCKPDFMFQQLATRCAKYRDSDITDLETKCNEIDTAIADIRDLISESNVEVNFIIEKDDTSWTRKLSFPTISAKKPKAVDIDYDEKELDGVTDCNDALGKGSDKPGVYLLNPDGSPYNVRALCVNGWTIVQRRFDGSEDFNREFDDYVSGFGNFSGEFFLGLENLHRMTKNKAYTLRVDVKGYSGKWYYGVYEDFMLSDEIDEYRLSLGNMSAGNYFDGFENGRDQQFSTRNRDNDEWRAGNCAEHYGGGWWSSTCSTNLNQRWCRTGCLRWATKRVVSSIIRIKPSEAVVEEDRSENPNPGGLTLDEVPA